MKPHSYRGAPARPDTLEYEEYNRAMLNILEDVAADKEGSELTQRAMLNILEDFELEKEGSEGAQRAMLNILEDVAADKAGSEVTQSAMLNILEDFESEKGRMEEAQRAMLNILDDFDAERMKSDEAVRELRKAFEDLRKAKEAADAANKEIEAFSYSVSHDLRAPLRHIHGFVDLLLANSSKDLDDKGKRYLNTISKAASQMGNLVDDLLSFSRMGRTEMKKKAVNMGSLFASVIDEIKVDLKERPVEWKIGKLPAVYGDQAMLRLVVVNLISNAVKFTRKNNKAIIEVGSYREEGADEAVIYVKDNGVGFDMQYVEKLFGVFQRLHSNEEFEGTGIGLANIRRIVSRHGGRTWAEGALGEGATFCFSLPLIKDK